MVRDLGGSTLAMAVAGANTIYVDDNAAGFGWFVDSTPQADEEFTAGAAAMDSPARGRMDLLTAVMHEMGHLLGRSDALAAEAWMAACLSPGTRRAPARSLIAVDALFALVEA